MILLCLCALVAGLPAELQITHARPSEVEAAADPTSFVHVPEDLEVSVFAAEPMLRQASGIDIDAQGRVWVLERVPSSDSSGAETERITVLHDTDQDGSADKTVTFYEDRSLLGSTGITVLGNRVVVSGAHHVFVLTDSDGDGKADQREILLTCTGGGPDARATSSLSFGADGRLYFTATSGARFGRPFRTECPLHGALSDAPAESLSPGECRQVERRDGPDHRSLLLRCKLDGSEVEVLRCDLGPDSGVAVDSFGTVWQMDGGLGRMLLYEGKTLPRKWWRQLIYCDTASHAVRACQLTPEGDGYRVTVADLLSANYSRFDPAALAVAPDGSVWVLDSPTSAAGEPLGCARIYRLARKSSRPSLPPQDWTNAHGWVGALQSPNSATRYLAWTSLHEQFEAAERHLLTLSRSVDACYRARAFQLLARMKGKENKYLEQCLHDRSEDIRVLALRIARVERQDLIPLQRQLAADPAPRVRRQCALALRARDTRRDAQADQTTERDQQDRGFWEALEFGGDEQ